MLTVRWMLLCERAEIRPDGRGNLIGVFSDQRSPRMPFLIPRLCVAAMFDLEGDIDEYLHVAIQNAKRQNLFESTLLGFQAQGPGGLSQIFTFEMDNVEIPVIGRYTVNINSQVGLLHSISFRVTQGT